MKPLDINDSQFEAEVLKSSKPVVVDFWAEWCGPCKALGPKLEEVAQEFGQDVTFVKVNVDENKEYASEFGIRSIPSLLFFEGGKVTNQIQGNVSIDQLKTFIGK